MAISVVGVGALAVANATTAATPALPGGVDLGHFLVCFSWARATAGSMAVGDGWTQYAAGNSGNFRYLISFRPATGSDAAPTVTPSGMSGAQKHMHRVIAFSGVDSTSPWGGTSTWTQNASAEDVGPVPAATAVASDGAVLVMACRLEMWTSVATLSGDGMMWSELVEDTDNTVGNALATVLDFAAWSGGAPTLTAKTFDVIGGMNGVGAGWMLLLNAAALNAYTLDAGVGNLGLSGQTASMQAGRRLDAVTGLHALGGHDAALARGYRVAADVGGYGEVGEAATQLYGRAVAAAAGSYAVSGQAVGLLQGHVVQADGSAYAALGQAAGVLWGHSVIAATAVYALAGAAATLSYGVPSGVILTAAPGDYALSGQTVALLRGRVLPADAGIHAAAGAETSFGRGCVLAAATGDYGLTGIDAALATSTPLRTLAGDAGVYGLTVGAGMLIRACRLSAAAPADFVVAGQQDTALLRASVLATFAGSYGVTGMSAALGQLAAWSPGSRPIVRVPRRAAGQVVPGRRVYVVEVN